MVYAGFMQNDGKQGKIPKIIPRNNNGSILIRFTYQGKDYKLSGLGKFTDKLCIAYATTLCSKIRLDIIQGTFDLSLDRYKPEIVATLNTPTQLYPQKNLRQVWEIYKEGNRHRVKKTTQIDHWRNVERMLDKLPPELLNQENNYRVIPTLLKHYSVGSIASGLKMIIAACNFAERVGEIASNPWKNLKSQLPQQTKQSNRTKQAFTKDEMEVIIKAFRDDRFLSIYNNFPHSYYADFVECLFLTGARPEEIIALRWSDIKGNQIKISKAYRLGVTQSTKRGDTRLFPMSNRLQKLINQRREKYPYATDDCLIFPSPEGKEININNFTTRYTRVIVKQLVKNGEISKYLPTYNFRNTAATLYLQQGIDKATIAALLGTSEAMLDNHYWASDSDYQSGKKQLPDL